MWFGRLLRVDLARHAYAVEEIPPAITDHFVGGKGLGTYYLSKEVDPDVDPLGPENKVFVAPGALNGTPAPAASRFEMVTKSPLTGIYADANAGGHFGPELKLTGHDLLILEGQSPDPVTLVIEDDHVTFRDASDLWGRPIYETERSLRAALDDPRFRIASIGPAGERLVPFACVSNDFSRQIGRTGFGAVLGAKRVKAIAVLGRRELPVADAEAFMAAVDTALEQIFNNPWVPHKREHGTIGSLDSMHELGITPVANFARGRFKTIDRIDSMVFGALVEARLACAMCPMACSKGLSLHGRGPDFGIEGPEYETASLFGPNCRVDDPQAIIQANLICNQEGLDTISAGTTVGMALAAAEAGRITFADLGLDPDMPRGDMVAQLLRRISRREGVGEVLSWGARHAAAELGIPDLAPHVKGLEFPAYDPRVSPGMALAYMTSDRGACHLRTYPFGREVSGVLPRWKLEQKAEFVKRQQDEKAAQECLGVCQFPYGIGLLTNDLPRLVSAAAGDTWTYRRLRVVGERIWTLSRVFSAQLGIDRSADYLPRKFSEQPMPDGPGAGHGLSRQDQTELLDRYYALRGWDSAGLPTSALWKQLDLDSLVGPFPLQARLEKDGNPCLG